MLFHYNGHGVPRATANGEIWVFNKVSWSIFELKNAFNYWWLVNFIIYSCPCNPFCDNLWFFFPLQSYTQYIPLSVYDLQTWMGSPSIFVYDCNNAGLIVQSFIQFAAQREQEQEVIDNCVLWESEGSCVVIHS